MPAPLYGLVLAGGESRRMGTDKGLLAYHRRSQRAHVASQLAPFCEQVFISVRVDQVESLEPGLTPLLDRHADIGPMAGLLAAFEAHPKAAWLVVACDLPFLTEATIAELIRARGTDWDAVAFAGTDGRPEPMAAIWEPSIRVALLSAAASERYSLRDALRASRCRLLPTPGRALFDVDTPADREDVQRHMDG
jgi:molybdopterin-guanine dinucleotide biosynthesis protein A